ncbi:MAG: A/G-specific adenine glycosylase [Elusimicrobiota bacterium]|nr:MAG: A/G-specific adenine glycosylase [Elusimicrobiota bacterium]
MSDARLRAALLSWYRASKRDLPWRKNADPYRVWISEIMLQQTTVAAVTPKYEAFLRRFPTLAALAAADEDEVLAAWAGLGYYSRARNLLRAARAVVAEHGGRFPSEEDAVLALPGIGRYTAGAIRSIAFGEPAPLVDGNVIRVFSRLFGLKGRAKDPAFAKTLWPLAERLVDRASPGDWNQALMELGATVCTPESPSCGACPVAKSCVAFAKDLQEKLPLPEERRAPVPVKWTCLWIERDGEVLLWKRSEKERLLKNLWGLPEAGRVDARPGRTLATVSHSITHHALTVTLKEASLAGKAPAGAKWVPREDVGNYLVSSLWLKLLRASA